ncbi:MAG: hypothetical protein IPG32_21665 [Saprospirales bacterium]|nr:hypothetical protein [Saprospirales bacterium]
MEKHYRAIIGLVFILLIFSFLGFYKTYFGLFPGFRGTNWAVHFHVFTILCWFGGLVAQGGLRKSGRIELHRKIGRLSVPARRLEGYAGGQCGWRGTAWATAPAPGGGGVRRSMGVVCAVLPLGHPEPRPYGRGLEVSAFPSPAPSSTPFWPGFCAGLLLVIYYLILPFLFE